MLHMPFLRPKGVFCGLVIAAQLASRNVNSPFPKLLSFFSLFAYSEQYPHWFGGVTGFRPFLYLLFLERELENSSILFVLGLRDQR